MRCNIPTFIKKFSWKKQSSWRPGCASCVVRCPQFHGCQRFFAAFAGKKTRKFGAFQFHRHSDYTPPLYSIGKSKNACLAARIKSTYFEQRDREKKSVQNVVRNFRPGRRSPAMSREGQLFLKFTLIGSGGEWNFTTYTYTSVWKKNRKNEISSYFVDGIVRQKGSRVYWGGGSLEACLTLSDWILRKW